MNSKLKDEHETDPLKRYTFTLPPSLVDKIEDIGEEIGMNRSQIVREAIGFWLSTETEKTLGIEDENGVGLLSYSYDHHDSRLVSELLHVQHDYEEIITSSTHVHLSHTECFEIVVTKGKIKEIKDLANGLRSIQKIDNFRMHLAPNIK